MIIKIENNKVKVTITRDDYFYSKDSFIRTNIKRLGGMLKSGSYWLPISRLKQVEDLQYYPFTKAEYDQGNKEFDKFIKSIQSPVF